MPDILSASYEAPTKDTPEYAIYDIQNTLLSSLILETVEQGHHYLLQEKVSAWDQYETLREYFDLGQHAQCYYATKELCTHRYTTKEAALATITAFGTRMREANIRTIDQLLPYAYMTLISHGYGTAINSLLTDKPHSMKSPTWTLKMVTKYFAIKHESKPRDYKSNRQDSSSNRQDSSSKKQESTSNTEADSHNGQQKRQKKHPRCHHCNKWHTGTCHKIINKDSNPSKPLPSDNTKPPTTSTATTELTANSTVNKSYFAKAMAETSQHN
jgi:hypothetical protein